MTSPHVCLSMGRLTYGLCANHDFALSVLRFEGMTTVGCCSTASFRTRLEKKVLLEKLVGLGTSMSISRQRPDGHVIMY